MESAAPSIPFTFPTTNPAKLLFPEPWCYLGDIPIFHTNPFTLNMEVPLLLANGATAENLLCMELTEEERANLKDNLEQCDIIRLLSLPLRLECVVGRIETGRKLTKTQVRKKLRETNLEGFENMSEPDIAVMSEEECEENVMKLLDYVFEGVDPESVMEDVMNEVEVALPSDDLICLE